MKVDHAVVAGLFTDARGREALATSQRQITGYLVDSVGNVIRQVSKPGKPDKVHVHVCITLCTRVRGCVNMTHSCAYVYKSKA